MTTSREAFLNRVRQAVAAGNRPGSAAALEPRGRIGFQGGGRDPVAHFREALTTAGGQAHIVPDEETAARRVLEIVQGLSARKALLGRGPFLDPLGLADRLRAHGVEVVSVDSVSADSSRQPFFAADVGISGVDYLIAETGSIALFAKPADPRSLSLLPPVHIAVAGRGQLLPDLFDLFEAGVWGDTPQPPSCLSLITGPSKTGDIELKLVTGVHGPGEVHVVLVDR